MTKAKRKLAQDAKASGEKRLRRSEALGEIRDQFNPFQFKHNPRGPKFQVTTLQSPNDKGIKGRPGVSKALGEERRRETLLVEMQKRNKVGGILDRRFGENDPTMAPEDKMLERFAREKQRLHKKSSLFDLEEDTPSFGLTHNGQALSLDGPNLNDDFDEDDLSNDSDGSGDERKISKRQRLADAVADLEAAEEEADEDPDRKGQRPKS
ncbi:unnamed protein product [Parascedosporium putredinis]|uniref:Nop14-like protein n=1 Tax=Parascedosporium putredinis TaxID=1442378 RepID=A0A9P1H5U0_9PEZI|nr:unnamed protein product [Parascedosporium putredinis]CAI7998243.1 unnamed protein product [Parascedosporium putredinis]